MSKNILIKYLYDRTIALHAGNFKRVDAIDNAFLQLINEEGNSHE